MKTQSRLCRVTLLFFSHSILLLTSTAIVAAQTPNPIDGCDATLKAKLHFKELRTQFLEDRSSVDKSEFRRAARSYIRLAEQCYELTVGESAVGQRIDEGGLWMGPSGATTTVPPVSDEFVLFGTKWGAGSPFAGGTDVPGPRLPGGTVTYSFMASGVDLAADSDAVGDNVAITSLGSFAPCFLDEIELAFGAWSAVADILFVPVTDGGGPFNVDPVADIRIGAHVFTGPPSTLAHGFFPPPNGTTAAGDIHFDSAEPWTCAPAAGSIGFGIIALHELGHAIGLGHELTEIAVMNEFYNAALTFGPLADDLIGAGEIYGEAGAALTSFFGPVGIGTDSPSEALHIVRSDTTPTRLQIENTNPTTFAHAEILLAVSGQSWRIRANQANGNFVLFDGVSNKGSFLVAPNADANLFRLGKTASNQVDINGHLVISGTCTSQGADCASDYVFDPGYEIESIEEHAASMWNNSYLPAVGPTPDNDGQGGPMTMNVLQKTVGMLNELEKSHIYIDQLNERLKQKEAAIEQLDTFVQDNATQLAHVQSENATLAKRLARLEALLLAEDR